MQEGKWITLKDGRRILLKPKNVDVKETNAYMNKKIRKEKIPEIIDEEHNQGDFNYCVLWMKGENDKPIAYLEYMKLNDMKKSDIYKDMFGGKKIAIKWVRVAEPYRRKGYATALFKKLKNKYPNEEIRFGQLEPDGEKLLGSIANITDSELKEGHKRLTYYGTIK